MQCNTHMEIHVWTQACAHASAIISNIHYRIPLLMFCLMFFFFLQRMKKNRKLQMIFSQSHKRVYYTLIKYFLL